MKRHGMFTYWSNEQSEFYVKVDWMIMILNQKLETDFERTANEELGQRTKAGMRKKTKLWTHETDKAVR